MQVINAAIAAIPLPADPDSRHSPDGPSSNADGSSDVIAQNLIVFGPPGTGKSWMLDGIAQSGHIVRIVFHPEFSYSEFVGAYRPVVGHEMPSPDGHSGIIGHDNSPIPRPVSYFAFVPGAFASALVEAKNRSPNHVFLVIEELNRGDCAAIFGDLLQLLDRREDGESRYGIVANPALGKFLHEKGVLAHPCAEVKLPRNLSLLATINSSDQSLYPIDAAFKRRWRWQYLGATEWPPELDGVMVADPVSDNGLEWRRVWSEVNRAIADAHRIEDKTIGPWYLSRSSGWIPIEEIEGKLLYYLWHDVFKEQRASAFGDSVRTFGQLQDEYREVGLKGTLRNLALDA